MINTLFNLKIKKIFGIDIWIISHSKKSEEFRKLSENHAH